MEPAFLPEDLRWMGLALRLARRGYGRTSPNPMVGAVLVKEGKMLGCGWHHGAGQSHAEIEAIRDAQTRGHALAGASLYVTLEPCSTQGRTPPCTDAILRSNLSRVCVGAIDPNPKHAGRGYQRLRAAGIEVLPGIREREATQLNEAFNHWIVQGTPFVTVKAAMSLDGKIATVAGESRWITGERSRAMGMRLRRGMDAILIGINTVLADNPQLTSRRGARDTGRALRRFVLDSQARTPAQARILSDFWAEQTTLIVSENANPGRVADLAGRARVLAAPVQDGRIDLRWLMAKLGSESVTSLLVEGGGEVNAAFLIGGLAHRITFFYSPRILGGRSAPTAVGGPGVERLSESVRLCDPEWRRLGEDLLLTGRISLEHGSSRKE